MSVRLKDISTRAVLTFEAENPRRLPRSPCKKQRYRRAAGGYDMPVLSERTEYFKSLGFQARPV